jgi:hypothetical protein
MLYLAIGYWLFAIGYSLINGEPVVIEAANDQ